MMTDQKEDQPLWLHHFSLNLEQNKLIEKLKDVRLVLIAGCWRRALAQAEFLVEKLAPNDKYKLEYLTHDITRFKLFKVGPVLLADHGMGGPSMSIAVHELLLMCKEANVLRRIRLIRFGTCGGLGVEAGNLCVTNRSLDPLFQDFVEYKIVGKLVKRACVMDEETISLIERIFRDKYTNNPKRHQECELQSDNTNKQPEFGLFVGATVAANDFYEEQGRTTGIICDHTLEEEARFLGDAKREGVINVEMESNYLAAMCHKLGIRFGVICVALTDRLKCDKFHLTTSQFQQIESRLFWLNLELAKYCIENDN